LDNFEIENKFIDSDSVFSGKILNSSSEETLCEEEFIDPIVRWDTFFDPLLEEFKSCF